MAEEVVISSAAPNQRWAALELTFSTLLPQPARKQHIESLLAGSATREESWRGLLVARRRGAMVGAVWAHLQTGLAANVWPPRLAPGENDELASRLLRAALGEIETRGAKTAQALVAPDDAEDVRRLSAAGFRLLAELVYLMSSQQAASPLPPASPLEFRRYLPADRARMAEMIDRTYVGSLDCPGLNGIRSGSEVLDEYQLAAAGEPANAQPAHWFFVQFEGADIGCLLLADHAELEQFELVYMGLVGEARGRGRGAAVVRYAQWVAASHGGQHLVLAVDGANAPALAMYEAAGMVAWDRRKVYLRTFDALGG